jgi:L-amino acid N-acyltransferase YncA
MADIRTATLQDAAACAAIYAPYVTNSVISFETVPPDADELRTRMRASHAWLVAEDGDRVVGYAYGSRHHERAAYRWAADVAIYLSASHQGKGIGRQLYTELFKVLRGQGFRMLCAGLTLPNAGSDAIHRSFGFEEVGVYRKIGWKSGAWHDVRWYQLDLHPGDDGEPEEPQSGVQSKS